ncbi:hypothetical protein GFC01_01940 [Desulfofundulus thermobenzoicus]|uniref:DUF4829 domain-containing protein n=1 Tax=Desulfofundulus thermobenzoicus TaxID=29376 RepID=A0A6N7IN72_9FIRM|nr:hypothetical protein [Desulfofundulus thermobenzoicus]MQL51049.1 hypothetical protein [Desulfofundulus thermobenzoicus]
MKKKHFIFVILAIMLLAVSCNQTNQAADQMTIEQMALQNFKPLLELNPVVADNFVDKEKVQAAINAKQKYYRDNGISNVAVSNVSVVKSNIQGNEGIVDLKYDIAYMKNGKNFSLKDKAFTLNFVKRSNKWLMEDFLE